MVVFSVILGILLVIGGFSLLFTPLASLMSFGYFIIILFFIYGVYGIVRAVQKKTYDADFFFSILSVILGIVCLFIPEATLVNDFVILYMAAGWFLFKAILTIWGSVSAKKFGAGTGTVVCGVILGILEIALTVYSILHPMVLAVAVALLLGFYFIEAGISMIAVATTVDRFKTAVTGAAAVGAAGAAVDSVARALDEEK